MIFEEAITVQGNQTLVIEQTFYQGIGWRTTTWLEDPNWDRFQRALDRLWFDWSRNKLKWEKRRYFLKAAGRMAMEMLGLNDADPINNQ